MNEIYQYLIDVRQRLKKAGRRKPKKSTLSIIEQKYLPIIKNILILKKADYLEQVIRLIPKTEELLEHKLDTLEFGKWEYCVNNLLQNDLSGIAENLFPQKEFIKKKCKIFYHYCPTKICTKGGNIS